MTQVVKISDFLSSRAQAAREEAVKAEPALHLEYNFKSEIFFTNRGEEAVIKTELTKRVDDYPTIDGWGSLYWSLQSTIYQLLDIIRDDPEFPTSKFLDVPSVVIHLSLGNEPKIHLKMFGSKDREEEKKVEEVTERTKAALVDIYKYLNINPQFFARGE